MRVLAAMSGGVDSSVATALAVEAGHEVEGVYLALHENRASTDVPEEDHEWTGCGNPQDAADAKRVAGLLGIDFAVWDYAETFSKIVVSDFLAQYAAGYTPNPCVHCNENIKFALLLNHAAEHGYDAVLTGHYANVTGGELPELHRANYRDKDQSYVLSAVGLEALHHVLFPLGQFESKDAVRAEAERRGLGVESKPDSYDICFIPDGNTQGFLRSRLGERPGVVQDDTGAVIGEHRGAYAYTIGQRRGLGLGVPAADGKPRYVVDVDVKRNIVTVGPQELLSVSRIRGEKPVWIAPDVPAEDWVDCIVQVRAHGREIPARVRVDETGMDVELDGELRGLARGQAVVAYSGTRVLGQSRVAETFR